jgi:hypothetical protein
MIIKWCMGVMGERNKIRMQEQGGKISGSKIGNSGNGAGSEG